MLHIIAVRIITAFLLPNNPHTQPYTHTTQELRIARQGPQTTPQNGYTTATSGEGKTGNPETAGGSASLVSELEAREARLQEELTEAREAANRAEGERRTLQEAAGGLREELAAVKAQAEVCEVDKQRCTATLYVQQYTYSVRERSVCENTKSRVKYVRRSVVYRVERIAN